MAEEFIEVSEEEFLGEPPSGAEEFIEISDEEFNAPGEEVGTSFSKEVSQLGPAFKESLGRPLENMGEGFEVVGFQGVANALKGAITEPENYVSAAERFMEPQPGESQFFGFAWQYAPRAAVEQTGQALAAIGGRIAGAAAGGLVAGPPGAIAGGFLGPAIIGAAQVIGPVAKERARNNGREVPTNQDLAAATLTAIGSGALDAIGARYLPGGDKATGKFFKRVASSFVGEGLLTEAPQSIIEQVGSTAGTEAGLNINAKQALGEGIIGGTTAAGLQAITYPLTKEPKNQVIRTPEQAEEIDIQAKSNEEAVSLMGQPADQDKNELISRVNEIEKVVANNETLINSLEPNDETRTQLELENKIAKQEAGRLRGELEKSVGLAPLATVEQRQIELARGLAEPAVVTPAPLPEAAPAPITSTEEAKPKAPPKYSPEGLTAMTDAELASEEQSLALSVNREAVADPQSELASLYQGALDLVRAEKNRREAPPVTEAPAVTPAPAAEVAPVITEKVDDVVGEVERSSEQQSNTVKVFRGVAEAGNIPTGGTFFTDSEKDASAYAQLAALRQEIDRNEELNELVSEIMAEEGAEDVTDLSISTIKSIIEGNNIKVGDISKGAVLRGNINLGNVLNLESFGSEIGSLPETWNELNKLGLVPETWESLDEDTQFDLQDKYRGKAFYSLLEGEVNLNDQFEKGIDTVVFTDQNTEGKGTHRTYLTKAAEQFTQEAAPAEAAPVGIAVGSRIKLGKSPQTYTIEEVLPQSEAERGLGEQFYSVKNERTGEVQTVESKDLKPVLARVRRGEKGGVLFLTREDFIQAGQNIYEAGMEFATWARQMVQRFGDAVRQFLGDIWQAVSGIPAKVNELAGFLPGKGEAGAVAFGRGEEPPKPPKKPAEPAAAPEKPAVEKKPTMKRYDKKSQVAGVPGIGAAIDTPRGINARTEKIIQDRVFNSDIVNDNQTKKAWNLIQSLESTNPNAGKNAEAINQLTRETMQDVDADEVVKQTVGAVKVRNELFKYAMKLTAAGDKRMLDYLLNTRLAFGGGTIVEGDPGRLLQAHQSLKNWIVRASEAERQGFFEAAAQQFFDTKTPTDEQIQQIKNIFNKVNEVKVDQEKELMSELEEVGKAAGVDLPAVVQKELEAAPGLDPMVVAMTAMQKLYGGTITTQYEPISKRAQGRIEGVKKIIQGGISNYRQKIVSKAANGLETGFWKTLATTEDKPGPLGELDAAQNRALGNIVKQSLVAMGLKGTPPDTKMTIYEQVASILGEQPLSKDKIKMADERIRQSIESKRDAELENASEDQQDAINLKYDQITLAWDDSMSRMLDMPVSETMLRRMVLNELKESDTSISEIATLMDEEPAIGASRQDRLVNSIIEKVTGVTFDGQPTRDYTNLKTYLSDLLESMVIAGQEKNRAAKSMAKVKRDAAGDPDKQAQAQIDKLAKIQADPTIFGEKKIDPVRNAVRDALSLKLDIGFTPEQTADIKRNWKGAYVADPNKKGIPTSFMLEMQRLGVSEAAADTLSEIVWNQIEVNAMNRQMDATTKAVEAGPLGGMVQAILDTPLAMQQDPEWRKKVITDYLKNAGIKANRADRIAELFDVSLRKRFAKAQEEAAISAAKSLKGGLNPASRRALEKFLKAIRAQVLDPGTDVAKAFGEQMGWTGFTAEQITKLNELDAIVNDTNKTDAEIAVAIEQINKIIDKVSAPPQVKDILASYYVGNILGRITTFTIQALDPLAFTTFNAAVDSFRNITNPQQLMSVWSNYGRGVSNLIRETAFSFKNDVLRSGKIIDYMARQDRQIGRLWDEAVKKWNAGDIRGAMKDGIFGYTAWTFRTLKALDDGAYSLLTTTTLPSYVDAALKRAKVPAEKRRGVMRGILEARELDIKNMVEQGIPRNDAIVYANEKMRGEVTKVLTGMNIDAQEVIDSAINDALSRIGKTRFKEDIHGKETEIKDIGRLSAPFLRFYESVAKSVNEKSGSESQKIFYRILLGFPLIPARIFNIAAGYTPLTIYRHFLKNRYSLTYGTALQRRQRIIEQMAGTAVLLPLLFLRSNSLDEEDEKERGFGIYITGQGPSRTMDRETRAQWDDRFDPYSIVFRVGNKSASIDARAAGPLSVMIYTLGAIDDWENRRKQEGLKTSKDDWRDVHEKASLFTAMYELAGSFLLTTARRGPTTGVIQGLIDFKSYPDDPIAAISKEVAFSGMPAVPVLGTGIVKNLSDLFSQPIDNKTKEGAILSNIPIVGPVAGQPALNAYGQRIGELRVSEKLKKSFGLPFTLITSDTEDDTKITSLTLKFGNGPTPIRRDEVENALKDVISDEEWYLAAKTFGSRNKEKVLAAYNRYDKMKPDRFNDAMNRLTTDSKNAAIRAVKQQRRNRP